MSTLSPHRPPRLSWCFLFGRCFGNWANGFSICEFRFSILIVEIGFELGQGIFDLRIPIFDLGNWL